MKTPNASTPRASSESRVAKTIAIVVTKIQAHRMSAFRCDLMREKRLNQMRPLSMARRVMLLVFNDSAKFSSDVVHLLPRVRGDRLIENR